MVGHHAAGIRSRTRPCTLHHDQNRRRRHRRLPRRCGARDGRLLAMGLLRGRCRLARRGTRLGGEIRRRVGRRRGAGGGKHLTGHRPCSRPSHGHAWAPAARYRFRRPRHRDRSRPHRPARIHQGHAAPTVAATTHHRSAHACHRRLRRARTTRCWPLRRHGPSHGGWRGA